MFASIPKIRKASKHRPLNPAAKGNRLRVLFVTSQDSGGGAPRAIHRIYESLREHHAADADVYLRVIHKSFNDNHIIGGKPIRNRWEQGSFFARTRFRKYFPRKPFVSDNPLLHSQALYASGLAREIESMKPDVILLGWLGNSTLSIREIGRLKPPVVWRLSDMWVFSGAEHYTSHHRFTDGYSRASRPHNEEGPDINRETFRRKGRHWRSSRHVISPSNWMGDLARASTLTRNWPVHIVPNVIDTHVWQPVDRKEAREKLGLPVGAKVVLFGAGSGMKDHHKGGDLFLEAISAIAGIAAAEHSSNRQVIIAAVFGEDREPFSIGAVRVVFLGRLNDENLRTAYSAADLMAVPSRMDNFPSTAVEAQACSCPVVAFQTGGLPDIVDNGGSGLLVEPFDTNQMAQAAWSLLQDDSRARKMGHVARQRALDLWAPERVATAYLDVLKEASRQNPGC